MTTTNEPAVRWLIRADMPEVLEIEQLQFSNPWTDENFVQCLRQRNVIGLSAVASGSVLGYLLYSLAGKHREIINLAVHPRWTRMGVGRLLVGSVQRKCSRSQLLSAAVCEANLGGHLFFRAMGMQCTGIESGVYRVNETPVDAYRFEWSRDLQVRTNATETARVETV